MNAEDVITDCGQLYAFGANMFFVRWSYVATAQFWLSTRRFSLEDLQP